MSAQDTVVMPRCCECKRIRVCGDAQKARGGEGGPGHPESACATADAGDLRQGPRDQKGLEDRKPPPGAQVPLPHHRKKGLRRRASATLRAGQARGVGPAPQAGRRAASTQPS